MDAIVALRVAGWALMAIAIVLIVIAFLIRQRYGSDRLGFAASGVSVVTVVLIIVSIVLQSR